MTDRARAAGPIAAVLLLLAVAPAGAQPFERAVDAFPVRDDEGALAFPFYGGLGAPRTQLVDIDGDADLDLFVQDAPDALAFFENVGTRTESRFVWRSDRYGGLRVGAWARFADLDGDGDPDLLAEQPFGRVRFYRNEGDRTAPRFEPAADTVGAFVRTDEGAVRDTSLLVDPQNTPAVGDFDCDGRPDLLTATVDRGTLVFYAGAPPGADGLPRFRFVSEAYGGLRIVGFGKRAARHGANVLALGDLDGDGDGDLLWGDFFSSSVYRIERRGGCASDDLTRAADVFPDGFRTAGFNAPALGDLDGDGDLDLLVGVLNGTFGADSASVENLYFFEQEGGAFRRRTSRFLRMIDVGVGAAPTLGDLDGDGALDLVVGNETAPGDASTGALTAFLGDGSRGAPSLRQAALNVDGLSAYGLAPRLADLDADGALDLVVGAFDGTVAFARGDGAGGFGAMSAPVASVRDAALGISGSAAVPALGDLDGDGDLDLVVGEASGALNLFRNDGTPTAPSFTFVTDAYLERDFGSRSAPALGDLDGDGDLDLLVGDDDGRLHHMRNDGAAARRPFVYAGVLAEAPFDALVPAVADVDGDGDADVLVGTGAGGGLLYLNRRVGTGVERGAPAAAVDVEAAPNPFADRVRLRFTLPAPGRAVLDVFDVLGRRVLRPLDAALAPGPHAVDVDARGLAPGLYVYRLYVDGRVAASGTLVRVR